MMQATHYSNIEKLLAGVIWAQGLNRVGVAIEARGLATLAIVVGLKYILEVLLVINKSICILIFIILILHFHVDLKLVPLLVFIGGRLTLGLVYLL